MKQDPQALLQQLNTLQTQILELAAASNLSPMPAISEQTSLKDLKTLLQQLTSSDSIAPSADRDRVLAILDRFLSLTHKDFTDFTALTKYQEQAREFRQKIANLSGGEPSADMQSLATGRHPIAVLLTLLEQPDRFDDRQWAQMTEVIAKAFGQSMAVAVSRGKLVFGKAPSTQTPATPTPPTPTPQPPATSPDSDVFIWGEDRKPSVPPTPEATKSPAKSPAKSPIVFGAKSLGIAAPASPIAPVSSSAPIPLKVVVHIQGIGDREFGAREFAGTRGQSRGIEGFQVELAQPIPDVKLEYMAHLAEVGDTPWVSGGEFLGTRGENRRMEGFAIRLVGSAAQKYRVCYAAHIQNVGDSPTLSDGKYCGTRRKALKIEALKVWIEAKGE
ncbi:MAG: hypothetical protein SWY16_24445 [Cyanobacteriota bacterium]|nr:hypothetical protein [Cyanobacteriota bacterium]